MKNLTTIILTALIATSLQANTVEQDSTGLPGDQFSLEAALDLFKNSADLESFETSLNLKDKQVNNLDLDGNGEVDYIRVVDHKEGDAHAIILQIAMGKDEAQDVAVIELEKTADKTAMVQIRGSEELYGKDVIFEPYAEQDVEDAKGPHGPSPVGLHWVRVWVNVWSWPCVNYMYDPYYSAWVSPWYWGYYPPWWRPWDPWGYRTYWGWHSHYDNWYQPTYVCRTTNANVIYGHRASFSPRIRTSTAPIRTKLEASRTTRTVTGDPATRSNVRGENLVAPRSDRPTKAPATAQPERRNPTPDQPTRTSPDRQTPEPTRTTPAQPQRTKPTPRTPDRKQPNHKNPGKGSPRTAPKPSPGRSSPQRSPSPSPTRTPKR
ncbi:MAG: hypothetical protein WAR83_03835 [Flavobacteriales bacterium]|nr:hypothetical protein [Flavobacteriales bacterium]